MQIEREKLLQDLNLLIPGLSNKGNVPQSDKITFSQGKMLTFNADVAVMLPTDFDLECAVSAQELLAILGKLKTTAVDVEKKDGELLVKAGRVKAGIAVEKVSEKSCFKEVLTDYEMTEFSKLPDGFIDALKSASFCVQESYGDILSNIHFKDGKMAATNSHKAIQIDIDADLPAFLVPGKNISCLCQYKFSDIGIGGVFLFFRNESGLVVAVRLFKEGDSMFPDMAQVMAKPKDGREFVLPVDLAVAVDKAAIFMKAIPKGNAKYVTVTMKAGRVIIKGKGPHGWYEESIPAKEYQGDDFQFHMDPDFLTEIVPLVQNAVATDFLMQLRGDSFIYVSTFFRVPDEDAGDY